MPHTETQLRALLDIAHGGFYTVAKDGTTLLCNKGFLTMLGFDSETDAVGRKLHDVIHGKHPDGAHYAVQDCPIYKCANFGVPAHVDSEFFYRLDGTPVPVEYWVHPILKDGEPDGAVCTFVDTTERRRAQDLQSTLAHELAHRIKNTLAMVQAIVHQSLRNAASVDVAREAIGERLAALANAHDILTRTSWLAAPIRELVAGAIAPHIGSAKRIHAAGPELEVAAGPALSLAMAIHELAMNSVKYGSLSCNTGTVELSWQVRVRATTPGSAWTGAKWAARRSVLPPARASARA
jgi:PAS domain S-box-containing protein